MSGSKVLNLKNKPLELDDYLISHRKKQEKSFFNAWYKKIRKDPMAPSAFFIAEIGLNHEGSLEKSQEMILSAKKAGANAVKFQTYITDELVHPEVEFMHQAREIFRSAELSFAVFRKLSEFCKEQGIDFLSTPFSPRTAHFLMSLGVPAMKVASGDINNMGLLAQVASFGKPVILSTGASDQSEVKKAVEFLIKRGNRNLLLMHCLSEYPAPLSRVGWYSIPFLLEHFGFPVGFSDHTQGVYGAITAFSLGARIIEKHFTLDKNDHAVDSPISADAGEFAEMVQVIREIEKGMGYMEKIPTEEEVQGNTVGRRGLYFAQSLPKGKRICEEDLIALRPQNGFSPANIFQVIGKKLKNPVEKLDSVSGEDFV